MFTHAVSMHRQICASLMAALIAGCATTAPDKPTSNALHGTALSDNTSTVARCEVDPRSLEERPAALGKPTYERKPAQDVRLRVIVKADGTASGIDVYGDGDLEAIMRSALYWRYRCQGNQGGVAEWTMHFPAQQCALDISSKFINPPTYPPDEFNAKVQGTVLLAMQPRMNLQGAQRVFVALSSGSAALDAAAVEAGKRWQFSCSSADVGESEPAQEVDVPFSLR